MHPLLDCPVAKQRQQVHLLWTGISNNNNSWTCRWTNMHLKQLQPQQLAPKVTQQPVETLCAGQILAPIAVCVFSGTVSAWSGLEELTVIRCVA
ncbi:hypothetical protein RRG08_066558 [Elysia crispata]|uniref:Uncharacterized protein n=1 Tax=Elysia crispata TaxID=231223 RepID=A0AAE0YPG6_9GAST|nr:hypothetical protein RRG08_066558 [Elysia crispata]